MSHDRESFYENTKPVDERLEALKQLYPEIFSDGKINLDAFKDVTNTSDLPEDQDKTPGYYGLYWPGKRVAKQLAKKAPEGTLEPIVGDGVNENSTHNIYIEGDNLEVLRILKQSYKDRIKMIYIDPPYNTGKDFIYPDNYKMSIDDYLKLTGQMNEIGKSLVANKKSNGAFHTNWLNMMYPRLQLARDLLKEDGVIFISIDDNEQANLKLLCDDIFGEENFIAIFPWRKRTAKSDVPFGVSQDYEWILAYSKSSNFEASIEGKERKYFETNDFPGRPWRIHDITQQHSAKERPNSFFTMINPKNGDRYECNPETTWRVTKDTFGDYYNNHQIIFPGDYDFLKISKPQMRYFKDDDIKKAGKNFGKIAVSTKFPDNIGMSENGTKDIKQLFETSVFSYPKPTSLIKFLINISTDKNSIILDFFSGSSTTAQSVYKLNKEDNGTRKFIMIQLPQSLLDESNFSNICEIGKERIRRSGIKILKETENNKNLDIGFKVFRLNKSNFIKYTPVKGQSETDTNYLFAELEKQQTPLIDDFKSENLLTEIILRQGFALDCSINQLTEYTENIIYKITDSNDSVRRSITLYICLDEHLSENTIQNLKINDNEKFICLDSAIDDTNYARLCDKGRIETI